ncbi:MAG: hypothetical protein LUD78_10640 [Clostridiales bacterium]|nr:hypothetical protein [Clostridiales bacterium]
MENSAFPRLFCAVTTDEAQNLKQWPLEPVWMAYRAGDGPRLYRAAPPEAISGGLLAAEDSRLRQVGGSAVFCQQAVRECKARGAAGFWANWSRPPEGAMTALTAELDAALSRQGLTLWVGEPYGAACPTARVLVSSALSGGTLKGRLTGAMERLGQNRVVLAVERMAEDFPLPAVSGAGQPLTRRELAALQERHRPKRWYSGEFCAWYFTYEQEGQVHLVLYDDGESIRRKLLLAQGLGVARALVAWAEVKDCAEAIFAAKG